MTTHARRIAVATCRDAWRADEDAPLLAEALAAAGIDAVEEIWDDPAVDWAAYDMVVIRSTWDYALRRDEFVAWADRVAAATELRNPAALVRWNTDKRYLAELAADGVPVAPTEFLLPGGSVTEPAALADRLTEVVGRTSGFVVKPTVSAGSKDTVRYAALDEDPGGLATAAAQAAELLGADRPVMVQPYLAAVDTEGETGLVFLGGRFSHAFRKGPLLEVGGGPVTELYALEAISPRTATEAQRDVAERVLAAARARTGVQELYARVDLLPDEDGTPVLLELELTEPSFFLSTDAGAAARAAGAIVAALDA
ncbi:ATP-grasp domain-containing protein [Dermatobacter hominis]|uniref:ATP-grasp domain-containing protein n=1 Tax=Dermatobacter hominis TaxID=2884263 RepID=UPI001D126A0E|nr:hypothetical protein [Dermatobacter hominis]UDY35419.1 hypothetical protein LH044_19070 [Dermatobacter hominis]